MESNSIFLSLVLLHWQRTKRSFYALLSLLLICLLAYNTATIFCTHVIVPVPAPPASFLPENATGKSRTSSFSSSPKLWPAMQHLAKARVENLNRKDQNLVDSISRRRIKQATRRGRWRRRSMKLLQESEDSKLFGSRVRKFFRSDSSHSSCKFRFFMTWISSAESFGDREMLCVESVFKAHPKGCLIIVSNTMDSAKGTEILRPFSDMGLRIAAISPDFDYLFKGTGARAWYNKLKKGHVNPGEVSLGQNLSNLLRMGLLYRFGGIYIDTDVIVLKSFEGLRNAIGAQTIDLATRNWSRLNNAVMAFDRGHPLLREFIEEFAKTFDGNKWGHNGPYLVSRVVSRMHREELGLDFMVLPPMAFYPVDWSKIRSLFMGPKSLRHSKWIFAKLKQIRGHSFAIHLWNKQSRAIAVEDGSIIQHVLLSTCVVCNFSSLSVIKSIE
ncbi:uncharacterized protein At4g19900-like [Andrographis paniculata]|uniref:uncharacterized protein At4g19900-like n=1 Tax=Andrographis paniculata TaxID=175694 RepID=UPI0021E856E6|nr:uncharacterized protein At4g19900-like [Andrographis paniculata]